MRPQKPEFPNHYQEPLESLAGRLQMAGEGAFACSNWPVSGNNEKLSLKDKEKLLWAFKVKGQDTRRARNSDCPPIFIDP